MDWIRENAIIYKDNEKPSTATGGKVDAGCIKLSFMNILGYEGRNWPFQIIMDEKQDFRNLLGRDLLTGFNYHCCRKAPGFSRGGDIRQSLVLNSVF